jgi:hypothetical protein
MRAQRVICIGDPHGCLVELKELIAKCDLQDDDQVIVVGDLVDRGPDSAGVVRYVREQRFNCVEGNHDNKFKRYYLHELAREKSIERKDKKVYKNPMRFSAEKMAIYKSLSDDDLSWLANLPSSIVLNNHGAHGTLVVHAGVLPGRTPLWQNSNVYRHCRYVYKDPPYRMAKLDTTTYACPEGSVYWAELYKEAANIIHGHHVHNLETPKIYTNDFGATVSGIDTGCCFGGKLTAVILTVGLPNVYVQVQAKKAYKDR